MLQAVSEVPVFDLSLPPSEPKGYRLVENLPGPARFPWPSTADHLHDAGLEIFVPDAQRGRGVVVGYRARQSLIDAGKVPCTARLLDLLQQHPSLIPQEWRQLCIYFHGSVYRNTVGRPHVRTLRYSTHAKWHEEMRWLNMRLGSKSPAAILAERPAKRRGMR